MLLLVTPGWLGIPVMDGPAQVIDDLDRAIDLVRPVEDTTHFGNRVVWTIAWNDRGLMWLAPRLRMADGQDLNFGIVAEA